MAATDSHFGLLATSRYVPHLRLERSEVFAAHRWMAPQLKNLAKGRRAFANWDEDAVTMAVEAGRNALRALPQAEIASLTLASTTLPFADRLNGGIVGAAIGLPGQAMARDVASSPRAASIELLAALRTPRQGAELLIASERRVPRPASAQELIVGHGAAAAVVGSGTPIATHVASASMQADFVDHFREAGVDADYAWEERWVRDEGYFKIAVDTVGRCLKEAAVEPAQVSRFAMPAPASRINEVVARRVGIDASALVSTEADSVGDLGCAQPLAMLDIAVREAKKGDLILVVAFGNGCDAMLLRRTGVECPGPTPGPGRAESQYLKYLSFNGQIALDWGMRAEMDNKTALSAAWRDRGRISRFEAGRCECCGAVQFPSLRFCVNPACRAENQQRPVSLADTPARVLSHTCDYLGYTPHPPFLFGHVDFDGGGRVLMEFADATPDEIKVGTPLRMVYRVKDFDLKRGFRRYFWKATPVRAEA
jgi:3-hydroxy-3-methylglutaryl CoA synthase/uncharacterized OB-fold protein